MSKRILAWAGVIQRENGVRTSGPVDPDPASSWSSRSAAARSAVLALALAGSTAPPGNTQAPPMNRDSGLRRTSSTSSSAAPPRSRITVAAGPRNGHLRAGVELLLRGGLAPLHSATLARGLAESHPREGGIAPLSRAASLHAP